MRGLWRDDQVGVVFCALNDDVAPRWQKGFLEKRHRFRQERAWQVPINILRDNVRRPSESEAVVPFLRRHGDQVVGEDARRPRLHQEHSVAEAILRGLPEVRQCLSRDSVLGRGICRYG